MDSVSRHYEAYPYPARDPADEATRLITVSPGHPVEIDHFLFGGQRDWSRPFRVLVAGGGTGDGLIMIAQMLADHGVEADILYLDISVASRRIAEDRARARGLTSIRFETGDLLNAADYGPFDYIDCCGVLHHLPEPDAGFAALRGALAEGGGIGAMVNAPYGRAGVYEMQDALRALAADDEPEQQVTYARALIEALVPTNGLTRNPFLSDHANGGDAGLHDLLLHSHDRPYDVDALFGALERADLAFVSFATPGRYDPRMMLADPVLRERAGALPYQQRAALAERLVGNIKGHSFYATAKGTTAEIAQPSADAVPVLIDVSGAALAESIYKHGVIRGEIDGSGFQRRLPKDAAGILMAVDGRRSLDDIRRVIGWEPKRFNDLFAILYQPLNNFGLMRFSRLKRGSSRS